MRWGGVVLCLALACAPVRAAEPSAEDVAQDAARAADYRARGQAAEAKGDLRDALQEYERALEAQRDPATEQAAAELRARIAEEDEAAAEARERARRARRAPPATKPAPTPAPTATRIAPPAPPFGQRFPDETTVPVVPFVPVVPVVPFDPVGDDPFAVIDNPGAPPTHRLAGLLIDAGDQLAGAGDWPSAARAYERALQLRPGAPLATTRLSNARARLAAGPRTVFATDPPRAAVLPFDVSGAPRGLAHDLPAAIAGAAPDIQVINMSRGRNDCRALANLYGYMYGSVRATPAGLTATATLIDLATGQRRSVREVSAPTAVELLKRAGQLAR